MTLPWSPRVGEVWIDNRNDVVVTVTAEHTIAQMVQLKHDDGAREWLKAPDFVNTYTPVRCESCGAVEREKDHAK